MQQTVDIPVSFKFIVMLPSIYTTCLRNKYINFTSDSFRQEQQNFYVAFFRNIIFISLSPPPPMNSRTVYLLVFF
jgi:hypothetical protein